MNRYKECLFRYGFITLCYLIDKYENEENYEECQVIYDAIEYVSKHSGRKMSTKLPTKLDANCMRQFKDAFYSMGLTGDTTLKNLPHYANEVEKYVFYTEIKPNERA